ncbi:MAG: hypothetical protein MZW92_45765 [Comamonadaceae bacterium]|nr:hypothetical protein [Comamonadaceae bacterium]
MTGKVRLSREFGDELAEIRDRTTLIEPRIQDLRKKRLSFESHIGPIAYVARMVDVPQDTMVFYAIMLLVFVADPLAVTLTIACNMALISFWDVKRPGFRTRADSDTPGLLESMVDRARSVAMLAYRETFEQEKPATQRRRAAGTKGNRRQEEVRRQDTSGTQGARQLAYPGVIIAIACLSAAAAGRRWLAAPETMTIKTRMYRTTIVLLLLAGCASAPPPAREPPSVPLEPAVPVPAPEAVVPPAESVEPAVPEPRPAAPAPRMQGLEAFAELNDEKLLFVYPGMSMVAVERIMGGRQSGSYLNPYKRQTIATVDGEVHEVLFYLTRPPRTGRQVTESQLTPVIFANNRVVAIGRYPLKKLRRSACRASGVGNCP